MVGIHTFISKNSNIKLESLEFLKHEPWFQIEQLESSNHISMFISHYNGYPFLVFKNNSWTIIIEGMIYNSSNEEIKTRCEQIADKFVNNNNYFNDIKDFISNCDGDFLIQIYDRKSNKYIVFNDHMGRLPLYYSIEDEIFIISRDIKTNLEFGTKIDFDLTGITEFLILGYSLGKKTYFKNIHKLEPYQAIVIKDLNNINKFELLNTCYIPFSAKEKHVNRDEILLKLKDTFLLDIKNRINKLRQSGYEVISDLSGGFDSRAMIGGLSKFDKEIKYFTYEYIQDESKEAQQSFNELGKPGEYIKLNFNNILNNEIITDLVYKTNGSVDFLTTSICYNDAVSLYDYMQTRNKIAHFGGYGGEFIRVPEKHFFKSIFYGFEHRFYNSITFENAIAIFNSNSFIKDEVKDYFEKNYRENKDGQLRRFFYEYSKVPLAGEERTRLFNWTIHPMWSKNWITTVYENVPLEWTGYKFFIEFLEKVDMKLLNVPIYKRNDLDLNSMESINNYEKKNKRQLSLKTKAFHTVKYYLPFIATIYERLRIKSSVSVNDDNDVYHTFTKYYDKLEKSKSLFNLDKIKENIQNFGRQYNKLTTLVMYLIEIEKRYLDKIVENRKNV